MERVGYERLFEVHNGHSGMYRDETYCLFDKNKTDIAR